MDRVDGRTDRVGAAAGRPIVRGDTDGVLGAADRRVVTLGWVARGVMGVLVGTRRIVVVPNDGLRVAAPARGAVLGLPAVARPLG
jgi:hypothetical protein